MDRGQHAHTKGSCKKRALQAGQDLTHLARILYMQDACKTHNLANVQDKWPQSCKILRKSYGFLQNVSDLGRPEVHVSCKSLLYGHACILCAVLHKLTSACAIHRVFVHLSMDYNTSFLFSLAKALCILTTFSPFSFRAMGTYIIKEGSASFFHYWLLVWRWCLSIILLSFYTVMSVSVFLVYEVGVPLPHSSLIHNIYSHGSDIIRLWPILILFVSRPLKCNFAMWAGSSFIYWACMLNIEGVAIFHTIISMIITSEDRKGHKRHAGGGRQTIRPL